MPSRNQNALLSPQEMARADQMTIGAGSAGCDLMEAAGLAVTRHITQSYAQGRTLILCGPGNNGGDGFVIARHLKQAGWDVTLALLGEKAALAGDAAIMAGRWTGKITSITPDVPVGYDLVIDGLFGTGLCRPITGMLVQLIDGINAANMPVVAVDMPSGVDGNSGQILGAGFKATSTVTFFRKKPGHLLYPGRGQCGHLVVADIGISDRVLQDIKPKIFRNDPALWRRDFPRPAPGGHKYNRGHAIVVSGGPANGGAARLGAHSALRIGAGLVSITCPEAAVLPHAAQVTAVMIKAFKGADDISELLADGRLNGWSVGPGCGVTAQTKSHVLQILAAGRQAVIDADALSVFADHPDALFKAIKKSGTLPILTPHAGEFADLFPDLMPGNDGYSKLTSARKAAVRANAVIIFKGPDTVIASPDGRAVINDNAPPSLATAGSGDVLAGLCLGLMVQGMDIFEAACAAAWMHGAAAAAFGPGLISEDIEGQIPHVLQNISESGN